jgi:hypothetical protein
VTVQVVQALLVVALIPLAVVAGVVLIRSACPPLRVLGWTLAAFVVLFGGLIVLTQGSGGGIYDDRFYFRDDRDDKLPDGGLELAMVLPPSPTS